jgi:hypothetical protein
MVRSGDQNPEIDEETSGFERMYEVDCWTLYRLQAIRDVSSAHSREILHDDHRAI